MIYFLLANTIIGIEVYEGEAYRSAYFQIDSFIPTSTLGNHFTLINAMGRDRIEIKVAPKTGGAE